METTRGKGDRGNPELQLFAIADKAYLLDKVPTDEFGISIVS
jgi:hypothetical protein